MIKFITAIIFVFSSFTIFASVKVIYGEDNRKDIYEVTDTLYLELAHSTAAQISRYSLNASADGQMVSIDGGTFASRGMCDDEKFANQITAARCSGFLVGDDILVTAGHCVTDESDCSRYNWVFGYNQPEDGKSLEVPAANVFKCKEILGRALDRSTQDDFAVVRLDRKAEGFTPLNIRREGKIDNKQSLVVIGHPAGLPSKVADGANVRNNRNNVYFVANLDTYGGNSGSAVFNAETGVVEGILVRGENDYVYDSENNCRRSNVCTDSGCRGEDVTRITNIRRILDQYL